MPGFIPDGYTRDGYIAEALPEASGEVLHEAVNLTYRAATRQEVLTLDGNVRIAMKNSDIDPKCLYQAEKLICAFTAEHVKSWDLKAAGVHPVEVNAANMEKLNQVLFAKVYGLVRGTRLSDTKPEETTPKTDDEMQKN